MKRNYQKALKKLTLVFLSNPVPFNGESYKKQKGSGASHQSLFRSQNKFRKIPLFIIILSDQVWWCNAKQFLSYSKNYMKSWIIPLPFVFWIQKVWKGREKITKNWISREKKELFRWNKKHFSVFTIIWWKNKNLIKNGRQALRHAAWLLLLDCEVKNTTVAQGFSKYIYLLI